ncbi:hypothetical protein IE53DRAFT_105002 [Violaceomyces palustris]|uniref:Uncharacterized protein n=1 Tax=Violaceomyces palustris TaxID=1673888 RepID=A0ACD0NWJ7_9BASI|nr:hypothetical protein IE53DRAFT_105002 [Violaceomyces palustris]
MQPASQAIHWEGPTSVSLTCPSLTATATHNTLTGQEEGERERERERAVQESKKNRSKLSEDREQGSQRFFALDKVGEKSE